MDVPVTCLCGLSGQVVSLDSETFPVKVPICHCNTCRTLSGVLCTAYIPLNSAPASLEGLQSYAAARSLTNFFCRSCGSHLFALDKLTKKYGVASGTIDQGQDLIDVVQHDHALDTVDGGLSSWLPHVKGNILTTGRRSVEHGADARLVPDKLPARCHCGGVEYFVTRPGPASRSLSSPWPDLLVPYHSGSPKNEADVKWWLRAQDTRYLAGLCACRSCRLAAGFPIQAWAFVPKVNLQNGDGGPMTYSLGTLRRYESSPGVYRQFCGACGASVFWHCEERPDLVDVSVGLLNSECGARAEDWLEWETGRVSFSEDAIDRALVNALETGLGDGKRR